MKILTLKEAKLLNLNYYFTGNKCKNGHLSKRQVSNRSCYICTLEKSKTWRKTNREYHQQYNKKYNLENPEASYERSKKYYKKMLFEQPDLLHERQAANSRKYIKLHKSVHSERNKYYAKSNKGIINAKNAKRRAKKLKATPQWANLDIMKEIYIDCQEINIINKLCGGIDIFVVDHIIPLQGKKVCGLHVHNNLAIITQHENNIKFNKFNSEDFK